MQYSQPGLGPERVPVTPGNFQYVCEMIALKKREKDEERGKEEEEKKAGSLHSGALRPDWKSSLGSSLKTSAFGESSSEFNVAFSHTSREYLGERPRF